MPKSIPLSAGNWDRFTTSEGKYSRGFTCTRRPWLPNLLLHSCMSNWKHDKIISSCSFRTSFNKLPRLHGHEVDLYLLYSLVTSRGGWEKVTFVFFALSKDFKFCNNAGKHQWRMGIPTSIFRYSSFVRQRTNCFEANLYKVILLVINYVKWMIVTLCVKIPGCLREDTLFGRRGWQTRIWTSRRGWRP